MWQFLVIFVITVILIFEKINCVCIDKGITVICETVEDFIEKEEFMWKDVLIQSDNESKNVIPDFSLNPFARVENLAIVGKTILSTGGNPFCDPDLYLKSVIFYGNNIPLLFSNSFRSHVHLDRLRMTNNQIQELEHSPFAAPKIKSIDLSDNLLDVLVSGTFTKLPPHSAKSVTEIIFLKNNKIAYIEPNTFPTSLRVLNLDNNQLRYLSSFLTNLTNLSALYVNNNKLLGVPDFRLFKKIEEIELSHNQIKYMEANIFQNLTKLAVLDLSYNLIKSADFLANILLKNNPKPDPAGLKLSLNISLAFNQIQKIFFVHEKILKNETLDQNIVVFFGNPWKCSEWSRIEEFIQTTSLGRTECDLKHFNSGILPFCVAPSNTTVFITSYSPFVNNLTQHFDNVTRTRSVNCDLSQLKNTRRTLSLYHKSSTFDECPYIFTYFEP